MIILFLPTELTETYLQSIQSRNIQLKIKRSQQPYRDNLTNGKTSNVTDAYLVSVDRGQKKQLAETLKRYYPDVQTHDMEEISQRTNNAEDDRLEQYRQELKKRNESEMEREREMEFLRTSLRSSKRLQELEDRKKGGGEPKTFENEAYLHEDTTPETPQQSSALTEVLHSINRITQRLEDNPEHKGDVNFLKNVFDNDRVRKAIVETGEKQTQMQVETTEVQGFISENQNQRHLDELGLPQTKINGSVPGDNTLKIVRVDKEADSYLGATVRQDGDKIIVGRLVKGGVLEKTKQMKEGDEIIEINGRDIRGKTVDEVCDLMKGFVGKITFVVLPRHFDEKRGSKASTSKDVVKHMRALFDYDPENDIYVPCKELALRFQKGDILHVISMADDDWWQAYREGDDLQYNLAGLIPSASFQSQLISYQRETVMPPEQHHQGKANASLLCIRRPKDRLKSPSKRRSTRERTSNYRSSAHALPTYSKDDFYANAETSFNEQAALTYEEVSLYLCKTDKKRPIILIGPPNVGCCELRMRIVDSDKAKYSNVVSHTNRVKRSGERDGIDHHFVTKQEFQTLVKQGAFVEWGPFQKYLYGTTFEAIRLVLAKGKSCILTLEPESLQSLRAGGLMPYVIFISPPSLQQLKLQKQRKGELVRDDEIRAIISNGKEIEERFGHYFDKLIINMDIDRSFNELKAAIRKLETEPQWVPSSWLSPHNPSNTGRKFT